MTNIDIENGPFIVALPIEDGDFSIAMLVYQRVIYPERYKFGGMINRRDFGVA